MPTNKYTIDVKEKGAKKASKSIGGLNNSLGNLAKKAGVAAAGFFGAQMLLSGMKSAINLAGVQEQAEKKLEVALGHRSKALLNQATALQKVTTFGDEAIIGVQASLAAFLDSEDAIKKATEATLDISVAMGMDLKAAGDLVAKTLGSSTNAMSRYGIQVEGAVGSTGRLESLTNNVATLFGGQAKAQAETMAGSIDQMHNAMGDAAESLGDLLAPAVINSAKFFKGASEAVGGYLDSLKRLDMDTIQQTTDQEKLSVELSKSQVELTKLINSPFKDSPLFGGGVAEEMEILEEKISIIIERMNATNILMQDNIMMDYLMNWEEFNFQITEAEVKYTSFTDSYLENLEKVKVAEETIEAAIKKSEANKRKEKEKTVLQDSKNAALSGQSASEAMKSVVRAEVMEAVAGYISSVLKTVPFPLNIGIAAAGGAVVAGLVDKALAGVPKFAEGFDGVVNQPSLFIAGEAGAEQVQVTPLEREGTNAPKGGITVNISAPLVDETVIDHIIPAIEKAGRFGLA